MLTITSRDSGHCLGVHVSGKLTPDDHKRLDQQLEQCVGKHDKVRVLFAMDDDPSWEPGSIWDHLQFSFQHDGDFERCAIIGNPKWQASMTKLAKPFPNVRFFDATQVKEARQWVGQEAIDEEIRRLAYQRWEAAGKPPGDGVSFWLEAEHEVFQ